MTLFLGSKELVKFIKKESITVSDLDEIDSQRMTCTMLIKGSIYPRPAVGLKGVTDLVKIMSLLKQRYTLTR